MSKNRLLIYVLMLIAILIIVSFFIPREIKPSADTRIILEHTYKTYIAPPCFEQAEATNYLQDSTLEDAQNLNYEPHDSCTEDELANEKNSLPISLLKEAGILNNKWDNW